MRWIIKQVRSSRAKHYTSAPLPLPPNSFFLNRLWCFLKRHYISIDFNPIPYYIIRTMSNCSKFSSGNELLPLDLYMTETHCYKPEVEGLSKQGMQVATNYFFRMTLLLWVLIYISNASSQSFIFWLLQCVGQKKNRNI